MKKILGIILILIGIFSGGMGIAVMGGGLAVPGFLVIAFGIYLLISSSKEDNTNQNNSKKKLSSIFLGILILIFGFINLFNGSLVVISLVAIVIGGGLIYYSLSGSKNTIEKTIKTKKLKNNLVKEKSNWSFWLYALVIPGGIIGIILLLGNISS
tara:strand:- start:491 stop:955 length:465 start_codon:yes stop_codon:yes gene_type:complete